nr:unnamed protein product [Callosobruchus analis]
MPSIQILKLGLRMF